MENLETMREIIDRLYSEECDTFIQIPDGVTPADVHKYITHRGGKYQGSEYWDDEVLYHYNNGFMMRVNTWNLKITVWRD